MTKTDDIFLDLKALSARGGLKVDCLRDHIRDSGLPAYKVKGKVLVHWGEFCEWVRAHRIVNDVSGIVDDIIAGVNDHARHGNE